MILFSEINNVYTDKLVGDDRSCIERARIICSKSHSCLDWIAQ